MKIIGHRGAKGLEPENTLAAFGKALEHHVDAIECDVRVTQDGVPVLGHDSYLRDPDGGRMSVAHHTLKQLKEHKPDLATLDEALRYVDRLVPVWIEVKPEEIIDPIIKCILKLLDDGWQPDDFVLLSRDFVLLTDLHEALPDLPTAVIDRWSGIRASRRARKLGTAQLVMSRHTLWSGYVRMMSRRGWLLSAYTLNDRRKAAAWAKRGLDGAITDYPNNFPGH